MLGLKHQTSKNLGHKIVSIGGLGHKIEPTNLKTSVVIQMEILK